MEAASLTPLARGRRMLTPDERLVDATRRGDDRAFEALYQRYHRRIAAYVVGMVKDHGRAEDVTQEVFLSALRRMRATDRDIVFRPWIYEIAKNACIDQFRRARRTDEVSYDAESDAGGVAPLVSGGPEPDEAAASREQLGDLCGAFGGLSEIHHQILVLRELEGRSYEEIGERMQMTRPAVESTLFRARKRLTEEYGELVSGERCRKVQLIIETAAERTLGARDTRTMARHLSHCQPCRRVAMIAGLEDLVPTRTGIRGKIAGLLPLPAFLRDRWLGLGASSPAASGRGGGGGGLAAWIQATAPMADSASGWGKAAAATLAVVVAGAGGAVATHGGDDAGAAPKPSTVAAAAAPVAVPAAAVSARPASGTSSTTGGGATTVARRAGGASRAGSGSVRRTVGGGRGVGVQGQSQTSSGPAAAGGADASAGGSGAGATGTSSDPGAGQSAGTSGSSVSAAKGTGGPVSGNSVSTAGAPVGDTSATVPPVDVNQTVEQTTQAVQGVVSGTTQAVQGVVSGTAETVQGAVSGTTQAVQGAVSGTTQAVQGVVGQTTQTVQTVVGQTASGVQGIVSGLGKPSSPSG